jgi:hypothetical protein
LNHSSCGQIEIVAGATWALHFERIDRDHKIVCLLSLSDHCSNLIRLLQESDSEAGVEEFDASTISPRSSAENAKRSMTDVETACCVARPVPHQMCLHLTKHSLI